MRGKRDTGKAYLENLGEARGRKIAEANLASFNTADFIRRQTRLKRKILRGKSAALAQDLQGERNLEIGDHEHSVM